MIFRLASALFFGMGFSLSLHAQQNLFGKFTGTYSAEVVPDFSEASPNIPTRFEGKAFVSYDEKDRDLMIELERDAKGRERIFDADISLEVKNEKANIERISFRTSMRPFTNIPTLAAKFSATNFAERFDEPGEVFLDYKKVGGQNGGPNSFRLRYRELAGGGRAIVISATGKPYEARGFTSVVIKLTITLPE